MKLPVLAKLMLAERFIPRLFDQIASAAARDEEGVCVDIKELEEAAASEKSSPTPKRSGPRIRTVDDADDSPKGDRESNTAIEWKSSEVILGWARVGPPLANVDLRPYLFVTKDRKDYFGATSALGRLAGIVEKLLGPKLSVQSFEGELKQLAAPEAAQVFEALRGRIMGGDSFDKAPPGVDGLTVLVRAHPGLQQSLLNLLEALPADRCGGWPAHGWDGVLKDGDAVARFEKLLKSWSASESKALKVTANASLRTKKGKS